MPARTPLLRGDPSPAWYTAAAAVPLAAIALADNLRVRRRLQEAGRDELTGLPRRQALTARGEQLLARRTGDVLVLLLDLDDFHAVNNGHGHAAGDQALAVVADRLRDWTAARDGTAARIGGDEFAGLARVPRGQVDRDLAALRVALTRPVVHDGQVLPVSVSVGAAHTADLPGGASWSGLLRAADTAMYQDKNARHSGRSVHVPLGAAADAAAAPVNGRRPGRPGTHLIPAPRKWRRLRSRGCPIAGSRAHGAIPRHVPTRPPKRAPPPTGSGGALDPLERAYLHHDEHHVRRSPNGRRVRPPAGRGRCCRPLDPDRLPGHHQGPARQARHRRGPCADRRGPRRLRPPRPFCSA
ncbi:GGDEF domain-containing protein [Yinghuangia aomiensis]